MIKKPIIAIIILFAALLGFERRAAAQDSPVAIELNKLESREKSCRVFVLIGNKSDINYQSLKLDLILFRQDGVIERRLALDLAPVRANKTSVKTFDLDALECSGFSSILINDAIECKSEAGQIGDCLDRLAVSSRASVKFTK